MHHPPGERRFWPSLLLRFLGALCALLCATTSTVAQTLPVPTLPPEVVAPNTPPLTPDGKDGKGIAQAPLDPIPQPRPRRWEYSLGVGTGYDSNIEFAQPGGPSGTVVVPRGEIGRVFRSPRGQLRAVVDSRWAGYPGEPDLNRYYTDFGLGGEYRSGLSTIWRGEVDYGFGYSDASPILLQQGVALPMLKTSSVLANVSVTRQVGKRTSLLIEGRFNRAAFDSSVLTDGDALRGTVSWQRQLNERNTAALVYAFEDVLTDVANRHYLTHFGSLQWTRLLSRRNGFLLEGGVSYTADALQVGLDRRESFFGGLTYTRRVGPSGISLFLRREVTPAFGFGISVLQTRAGLRAEVPVGRDWKIRLEGGRTQPDKAAEAAIIGRPTYTDTLFSVARQVSSTVWISAETRYRRRGATSTLGLISSFQGGVFVTFTPPGGTKLPQWGLF